jgi:TRAP-type transport system periplasmic protein
VSIVMNQDAWKKLSPKQREFIQKQSLALEAMNGVWKKLNAEETKRQAQVGIQTIKFDQAYVDKAYEIAWAGATKQSPEHAPQMRKLFSK